MPPFSNFTTKAKEAIRKAHELAISGGQNHVNPQHLLAALLEQEESIVTSILERLNVDPIILTDTVFDALDVSGGETLSPSYQIYLTPELAQTIEVSGKIAADTTDEISNVFNGQAPENFNLLEDEAKSQ